MTAPKITSGIVTKAVAVMAGTQEGTIDVHAAGTESAVLTVRIGEAAIQFTTAAQAQAVLGHFGMLRPNTMGMHPRVPIPVQPDRNGEASTYVAVTFTDTPGAAGTRESAYIPAMRRTVRVLALTVGPIRFRIMDTDALTSTIEILQRAHAAAVGTFADGHDHRANPLRPSFRPRAAHRLRGHGPDWQTT